MQMSWIAMSVVACVACVASAQNCQPDWSAETGDTPSARRGAAMAYDSARGRLVLFGGLLEGGTVSNATWEFDGSQWAQVTPVTPPSARYGHAMAYDSARHVVVLFGGALTGGTLSSGTYEYNGTTWAVRSPASPPPARQGHAMAYDSQRGRIVMFGGATGSSLFADTREFDGTNWTLVSSTGPAARQGHALAYDTARHVTVMFGGRVGGGDSGDSSETWERAGAGWTLVSGSGPAARSGHSMSYDSARGLVVLFGGVQATGYLNSTWEYASGVWTARDCATAPAPRAGSCMAFDGARARTVLCGGDCAGVLSSDGWELIAGGGSAPQFSQQPSSVSANPGDQVSFPSQANGAAAWRWRKDGVLVTDGGRISGAGTRTLMITGVTGADWGTYRAEALNNCGLAQSDPATLTQASHCGSSDYNCDGDVGTDADIESFFACLAGNCPGDPCATDADFNGDGDIGTDADIEAFFRVLAGGPC
jgi:hypothetical protein